MLLPDLGGKQRKPQRQTGSRPGGIQPVFRVSRVGRPSREPDLHAAGGAGEGSPAQEHRSQRLAGDVVAADHPGVFRRQALQGEELTAVRRAEAGLLRVLKQQDHVLAEGFPLKQTGEPQQGSGVPVVTAEMPGSVFGRHRVVVGTDDHGLRRALVMLRVEPRPAVHHCKRGVRSQKFLNKSLRPPLRPGAFGQAAKRVSRLDEQARFCFIHSVFLPWPGLVPVFQSALYHNSLRSASRDGPQNADRPWPGRCVFSRYWTGDS